MQFKCVKPNRFVPEHLISTLQSRIRSTRQCSVSVFSHENKFIFSFFAPSWFCRLDREATLQDHYTNVKIHLRSKWSSWWKIPLRYIWGSAHTAESSDAATHLLTIQSVVQKKNSQGFFFCIITRSNLRAESEVDVNINA